MTTLTPLSITDSAFLDYGQPIFPVGDLEPYSSNDAKLYFDAGPIRFYIMNLDNPGMSLIKMTRHTHCSQCLASADAEPWWIPVAAPNLETDAIDPSTIRLFRVEPRQAIKLTPGTWHAGPYFKSTKAMFYNLELSNTKVADHETRSVPHAINLELS
jgi:hypothetical protein